MFSYQSYHNRRIRKDTLLKQAFRECLTFIDIEHFPTHIIRSLNVQGTQDQQLCKKPLNQTNLGPYLERMEKNANH